MIQHTDVIIVGAGISGIGAAYHLSTMCPNKSYTILEARTQMGGTWDLFKYPGIRSDSDMFTLGYAFKPWEGRKSITDGQSICDYIKETAHEYNIDKHIRYSHQLTNASWDTTSSRWTLDVQAHGKKTILTCNFLLLCAGYYKYEAGYTPEFKGLTNYKGQFIHPQLWPEQLDYTGKKIVIIGSGATAVTLLPALIEGGSGHVTMLQRSPTYMISVPESDPMSNQLRKLLPAKRAYQLIRGRNIALTTALYQLCRTRPDMMRKILLKMVARQVGPNVDMAHFTPTYNPWDQRLCAVPNGDLFRVLRKGKASIVTDHIDHFTETGIMLTSGQHLDADIIVSATGLDVQAFGGINVSVDGKSVDISQQVAYKSLMLSNVPNAASIFGYTNSSWTLKADLAAEYICRLLQTMDKKHATQCMPVVDPASVRPKAFVDITSGYIQRALDRFPKQGESNPWKVHQNYALDIALLRFGKIEDGVMTFSTADPAKKAGNF